MVGNVTGWNELINGSIISASTVLYSAAFNDWYITLMFLTFKVMLFIGIRSVTLSFVTSIIFISVFRGELDTVMLSILGSILAFELAGILYMNFYKK